MTILQITFTSIASLGTTTQLTFGDIPTVCQVANPEAQLLSSSFVNGAVTIPGPLCAQPTFAPAAGSYSSAQSVSISTTTSGATIRYTTDGSTPSETNGVVYTGPVTISSNTMLQALAYANGMTDSPVASAAYTILCALPTFSPANGTFTSSVPVTISTATSGATIRYTTNGSTPSGTNGVVYSGAVTISSNTTLRAIAYASNMADSPVASTTYIIQCATPSFTPAAGTYASAQSVTISTATTGATIRYTTDGSTPSEVNGIVYSGTVTINSNTTLQAIAYLNGLTDSPVASAAYAIQCAAPAFTPATGTYASAQSVTISTATSGASIRYTTDGSTPSEINGIIYSGAVTIGSNTTLQAIAYLNGMTDSPVASAAYAIKCAIPTFSPTNGTFTASVPVTISTTTSGATIRYTTDGSTPSEINGIVYSGAVTISSNTTLQAIAYLNGMLDSPVASTTYAIKCAAPTFTPGTGNYAGAQSVAISTTTSGATIRYTIDGSTPSEINGIVYSGAVTISSNTTLQALAYANGMTDSPVASAAYTIQCALPIFSPANGIFTSFVPVTISTATSGATIRYTANGSTPSETNGVVYSGAVTISSNTTLRAIAYASNMVDSPVASTTYIIQCATPSFTPAAGTYASAQSVTISSATTGATIRYTTDGSTPSEVNGIVYSGTVTINSNTTLQAIAYLNGMTDSPVASAAYAIQCAAPAFTPATGTYASTQSVTISTATSGATIRYTTDGSTPSEINGIIYSGAVTIGSNTTLQAIAYLNGMTDSPVASAAYAIKCAIPTFSPTNGTFTASVPVTISTTTSGATIRYTTDGSTPSEINGIVYSGAVTISSNTTLQAIAYLNGMLDSPVASTTYAIKCAAPTFTPGTGNYAGAQSVAISTTTSGATIRYTIDGSTPSEINGIVYSGAVTISSNTTLQALAYANGMTDSPVASAAYTIQCALPIFSPANRVFTSFVPVTISTATSGATIRYTTNGSTPSETNGSSIAAR